MASGVTVLTIAFSYLAPERVTMVAVGAGVSPAKDERCSRHGCHHSWENRFHISPGTGLSPTRSLLAPARSMLGAPGRVPVLSILRAESRRIWPRNRWCSGSRIGCIVCGRDARRHSKRRTFIEMNYVFGGAAGLGCGCGGVPGFAFSPGFGGAAPADAPPERSASAGTPSRSGSVNESG